MNLNDRELATILAALRYWQAALPKFEDAPLEWDIATNYGTFEPMHEDEIDALAERINTTPPVIELKPGDRRWCCPACKSKNVQVSFPAWHYEGKSFELVYIETGWLTDIMWWYCEDCDKSDCGSPEEAE